MPARRRIRVLASLALLLCAGSTLACKEGDPLSGGISPATAEFTADPIPDTVTAEYVSLRVNSIEEGRIVFDVLVTEIDQPVAGIALKLTYPEDFSRFVRCTDGDVYPTGECYFSETSPGSGEVFIGRSASSAGEATPISGTRVIVRVEFLVFGQGARPIVFEGQNLGGSDASAVLDVNIDPIFVRWFSGSLGGV